MKRTYKATIWLNDDEDSKRHDICEIAEKCEAVSLNEEYDLSGIPYHPDDPVPNTYYLEIEFDSGISYHLFLRKAKEYLKNIEH